MFFLTSKKTLFLLLCIFFVGYFVNSSPSLPFKEYRAAFVVPLIKKNNKTYVLVGCEAGGKDKGTYCIPGGSSGWWIFRDTNPLDTASREFCEETLASMDYKTLYALIEQQGQMLITNSQGRKIISYTTLFQEQDIDNIVRNFKVRRANTWFWQYYYREMSNFALIDWGYLMNITKNALSDVSCWTVEALVFNSKSESYEDHLVVLRPILTIILQNLVSQAKKEEFIQGKQVFL